MEKYLKYLRDHIRLAEQQMSEGERKRDEVGQQLTDVQAELAKAKAAVTATCIESGRLK